MQFNSRVGLYSCNEIQKPTSSVGTLTGKRGKIAAALHVVGTPPCHYQLVDSRIELYSCQGRVHKTHVNLTEARGKIAAALHVVGAPLCHYQLVDSRIELYSCQGRVYKTHGILTEARGKIVAGVPPCHYQLVDSRIELYPCHGSAYKAHGVLTEARGKIATALHVVGTPPCHYQLVDSRIELYSCQGRVHKTHGILTEARGKIVVSDLFVYHEVVLDTGLDAAPGTLNVELLVHTIGVATLTGKHGTLIGRGLGRVCRYQLVDSRIQLYMCRNVVPVPDSTLTGARGKIAASINVEMSRVCYHTLLDSRIELYSCAVMEPTNYGFLNEARGRIDAAANTNRLCAFQIPDRRFELPQLFSARRYVPQGRLEVNPIGPLSNRLKTAFVSRLGYGRDTLDQRTHNNALSLFLYFSCNHSSTRFEANNVIAIYNSQDESILTLDLIGIETNATQPDVVRVRSHIMTDPPFVDVLLTPTTLGGRWYKIGVTLVPSSEDTTAIFVHQGGQLKFEVGTFNSFERTSWKTQFAPEENVNIAAAYTWDRVLSDPEYWQLSEQPFGIWLPD